MGGGGSGSHSGNLQTGRESGDFCCCVGRGQTCPRGGGGGAGFGGGGIIPRDRETSNPSILSSDIGVRIVNKVRENELNRDWTPDYLKYALTKPPANPVQRHPVDLCPNGFSECCYNSLEFVRSIEGTCVPVGQKCSEGSGVGNRASGLLAGTIGELNKLSIQGRGKRFANFAKLKPGRARHKS